ASPAPPPTRSPTPAPLHPPPTFSPPPPPPKAPPPPPPPKKKTAQKNPFHKPRAPAPVPTPATIHSLRHSWATHLIENGVSVRVVQLWMGHTSPTTTAIYTHLTKQVEECAAKALDKLTPGMP